MNGTSRSYTRRSGSNNVPNRSSRHPRSQGRPSLSNATNYFSNFFPLIPHRRHDEVCCGLSLQSVVYYVCIAIFSLQIFITLHLFLSKSNISLKSNPYDKGKSTTPSGDEIDLDDPLTAVGEFIEGDDNEIPFSQSLNQQPLSDINKNINNADIINPNQFSFTSVHFNPSDTGRHGENNIGYINTSNPYATAQGCHKYTYMQLTDGSFDYLYGILSIHGALIRTKSKYSHNIMLMPGVDKDQIKLFHYLGIGTYNINPNEMSPYLSECYMCWNVTFYKMFIWNMTQFEKVLYLDTDVGIMANNKNMNHDGFDSLLENYPTPAAVSDRANQIELNGGILLVRPNQYLFNKLLKYLPNVRNPNILRDKQKIFNKDPWNCEWREYVGDQGFINSFFQDFGDSRLETDYQKININAKGQSNNDINDNIDDNNGQESVSMPDGIRNDTGFEFGPFYNIHYRYGILSSRFSNPHQWYFLQHRPYMIKGVHFTVYKPWHKDGLNRLRQILTNMERASQGRGNKEEEISYGGEGRVVYTDEMMTRFWVRYWLDVRIALNKCGNYCKKNWPQFEIPGDVDKWLNLRPEPFTEDEDTVKFKVEKKSKWGF